MRKTLQAYIDFKALGVSVVLFGLIGCNAGSTTIPSPSPTIQTTGYQQIERLARPAVKEAFQNYADHDVTNRSNPYDDSGLSTAIKTFTNNFRDPAYGNTLSAVLIPDELQADLSKTVPAYLGVETGGATGGTFGGRALNDDVIDISLGAIFGKTLSALGLVPDDGKSVPCLTTDNEPGTNTADGNTTIAAINAKNGVSSTFPYLGSPK